MSDDRGNALGGLVVAFLAGAAVGAAVALLTSPKSGPEMRESLANLGRDVGKKIRQAVGQGEDESGPAVDADQA